MFAHMRLQFCQQIWYTLTTLESTHHWLQPGPANVLTLVNHPQLANLISSLFIPPSVSYQTPPKKVMRQASKPALRTRHAPEVMRRRKRPRHPKRIGQSACIRMHRAATTSFDRYSDTKRRFLIAHEK